MRTGLLLVATLSVACAKASAGPAAVHEDASTMEASLPVDAGIDAADAADDHAVAAGDRQKRLDEARAALAAGTWTGGELYAAAVRAAVMNTTAWPEPTDGGAGAPDAAGATVYRLGYLRHGSHAPVFPEPIVNDDCPEGWFELLQGGYVCGKSASSDPKAPAVRFAANPPNLESAMPYRYGYALSNDTPVYRRVLSLVDRRKFEPWLVPAAAPVADAGEPGDGGAGGKVAGEGEEADNPYAEEAAERPAAKSKRPKEKERKDTKLASLKGRGALAHKMMKGFYVALDRDFTAAKAHWWRTAEGFAIPYERIALQGWSPDFHGSWVVKADPSAPLPTRSDGGVADGGPHAGDAGDGGDASDGGDAAAPIDPALGNGVAALVSSGYAVRYYAQTGANDKHKMVYGAPLAKWTLVELAGDPATVDGVVFQRTIAGFWVRLADAMIATPEPPADLAENEKWIDVDLGRQLLVAFEGKHPVYGTRVSSGKHWAWDPEHDHRTPTGTFRIYEKHVSTTMDGDVASDGPYSIEDVPWVMYFQGGYALHGAFWHNYFGSTRSHGCVNLSPIDAREIFFWTEPLLPKGWHGVFQTGNRPGTRVVIHEPPEAKKK